MGKTEKMEKFEILMDGKKQYQIPLYQRPYSWTDEQSTRLWKDILQIGKSKENEEHYLGTVVYSPSTSDPMGLCKYIVVDGQQRLLTLSILMIAVSRKDNTKYCEIRKTYLINKDINQKDDEYYKLLLNDGTDRKTFEALINNEEESYIMKEPYSEKILNCFRNYQKLLEKELDIEAIYHGIDKLKLVGINVKSSNVQQVFESINATGIHLTDGDLIKNYLFMQYKDIDEQQTMYDDYWSKIEKYFENAHCKEKFDDFLREYLMMENADIVSKKNLYDVFKEYCEKRDISTRCEEIFSDLKKFAEYYTNIISSNDEEEEIKELWKEYNKLGVYQANPLIMRIYDDYKNKKVEKEDFRYIIKLIISYIYRRYICNLSTQSLSRIFLLDIMKYIREEFYKDSIEAAFLVLMENTNLKKRFPNNNEFEKSFKNANIYEGKYKKYTLISLENCLRKSKRMSLLKYEDDDIDDKSIEHILPNTEISRYKEEWKEILKKDLGELSEEEKQGMQVYTWEGLFNQYVHTIGNLTLTS